MITLLKCRCTFEKKVRDFWKSVNFGAVAAKSKNVNIAGDPQSKAANHTPKYQLYLHHFCLCKWENCWNYSVSCGMGKTTFEWSRLAGRWRACRCRGRWRASVRSRHTAVQVPAGRRSCRTTSSAPTMSAGSWAARPTAPSSCRRWTRRRGRCWAGCRWTATRWDWTRCLLSRRTRPAARSGELSPVNTQLTSRLKQLYLCQIGLFSRLLVTDEQTDRQTDTGT